VSYLQSIARRMTSVFRSKPQSKANPLVLLERLPPEEVAIAIKADQDVKVIAAVVATPTTPEMQMLAPLEAPDLKQGKQVQTFFNETENLMEITIEYAPDLYLLKPGEEMRIFFEPDSDGTGLYTMFHEDGSLQVFLENYKTTVVTINGRVVEPWNQLETQKAS
jgi:hypothetical protein